MSTPRNPSGNSKETAISAFVKLDQASQIYQRNHHADLSSILDGVPQQLSSLIPYAVYLKEKCQNARRLFKNVLAINLEVIAVKRDDNYEPPPVHLDDELGYPSVRVPEERGRHVSTKKPIHASRPGSPQMVIDVTESANEQVLSMQPRRIVRDGVDDAATFAYDHHEFLEAAHDAQDGIFFLHSWAIVSEFEEDLRQNRALDSARRVLTKSSVVQKRSYTKNGVPFLLVISGIAPINEIEIQNRTLSQRIVIADLFISFYSDVVQNLQFVHDNLDIFPTVHRKLSQEMKVVTPAGVYQRDVLGEAVMATSAAYDAVKN